MSLLANDEYSMGSLRAQWIAFDQAGDIIGTGAAGENVPVGDPFEINIQLDNIWSVVMGGEDSIAVVNFDYLTFEFEDYTSVPEPNVLLLLLPGLLMIALRRKFISLHSTMNSRISSTASNFGTPHGGRRAGYCIMQSLNKLHLRMTAIESQQIT